MTIGVKILFSSTSFRLSATVLLLQYRWQYPWFAPIYVIFNNFVFIASCSSRSLSHFLLSVIYLKLYLTSKWLYLMNAATTIVIWYFKRPWYFYVKSPLLIVANHFARRSINKKFALFTLIVITFGIRRNQRPRRLFLSLEQPRMIQNEGIVCCCMIVFTPPRWRRLLFSWRHSHVTAHTLHLNNSVTLSVHK